MNPPIIIFDRYIHALVFDRSVYDLYKAVKLALKYDFVANPCVQYKITDALIFIYIGPTPTNTDNDSMITMRRGRKKIHAITYNVNQMGAVQNKKI